MEWPKQDEQSMKKFYGEVGENQTTLVLPYTLTLAWPDEKTGVFAKVKKTTCRRKVHDSLERILSKTLEHYGIEEIRRLRLDIFGGCLDKRKMRGGNEWSIHAWGTAVDMDPDNNQLRWGRERAWLARPEYEPFWNIVESEGWVSLGRSRDFDWMGTVQNRVTLTQGNFL